MTARKPCVVNLGKRTEFTLDKIANCLPDDIVELEWTVGEYDRESTSQTILYKYAFCRDMTSVWPLEPVLSYEMTALHVDPEDWFSELLKPRRGECPVVYIDLDPRKSAVRRRYPWVCAFWPLLRINCNPSINNPKFRIFYSACSTVDDYCIHDESSHSLYELWRHYNKANRIRQEFVIWRLLPHVNDFWRIREKLAARLPEQYTVQDNGAAYGYAVIRVDLAAAEKATEVLNKFQVDDGLQVCRLGLQSTLDHDYFKLHRDVALKVDSNAYRQWRVYHLAIVGVSVAFDQRLPPYVLLWILDWLPLFEYWPQWKKVQLLESVRDSIERCRANRQSTASPSD